jgi:aspartate aminotransferase
MDINSPRHHNLNLNVRGIQPSATLRINELSNRAENNWQLTAEEIDLVCRDDPTRPRILILNYPNNPTGCTYSDSQLQAIAIVARKYKLKLLSDEIYGELK